MKTRLNGRMRNAILSALLTHRFKSSTETLEKERLAIGDFFYETMLAAVERKAIENAPRGWFMIEHEAFVVVAGNSRRLPFSKARRIPASWSRYGDSPSLSKSHPVTRRIAALDAAESRLKEERQTVGRTARATLNSVRYVEDLVEAWPKVKRFVPKGVQESIKTAPPVSAKKLDEMLGL